MWRRRWTIFVLCEFISQLLTRALPLHSVQSAYGDQSPELLHVLPKVEMVPMPKEALSSSLIVDASQKFQEILGFGGAFTEAAAISWRSLSPADQTKVLQLYFGDPSDGGHGYTMGRVPIGSTDFSPTSHSFDDVSGDLDLRHFDYNATHDEAVGMLPMIRAAQDIVHSRGYELKLVASPWSPPAWMKMPNNGNLSMIGSAAPNGLNPKFQRVYAKYFVAFLDTYKHRGINVWGITVQNEPENPADWEGCLFTKEFMAGFVREHLGPVLKETHPQVKILGYDHNKDHMVEWSEVLYGDNVVRSFVDGMAVHWYGGLNTEHLNTTHWLAPEKYILSTESCNCGKVVFVSQRWKWWQRAEQLALDCLADLRFWANGYIVWNLILNTQGGPNKVHNICDADLIADPAEQNGLGSVVQQASYYLGGHFSRFIPPGSYRIAVHNTVNVTIPPLSREDLIYAYSVLETCKNDENSIALQSWSYDADAEQRRLKIFGLCFGLKNNRVADGTVFSTGECGEMKPPKGWAGRFDLIPVGGKDAGHRLYNRHAKKCVTSTYARGSDIGLDRGVRILLVELFPCYSDAAINQTFHFLDSAGHSCNLTAQNQKCRIATAFGASSGEHMCLHARVVRRPFFSAAAFQTPDGKVSVVALNIGDKPVNYTLYDAGSNMGIDVHLPKHAIASYIYMPRELSASGLRSAYLSSLSSARLPLEALTAFYVLLALLLLLLMKQTYSKHFHSWYDCSGYRRFQ